MAVRAVQGGIPDYTCVPLRGVVVRDPVFGEGAERMVHQQMYKARSWNPLRTLGPPLVAKESRFLEDDKKREAFHRVFCQTQGTAQKHALKFNERTRRIPQPNGRRIPYISFLECSVYLLEAPPGGSRGVLVERMFFTLYDINSKRKAFCSEFPHG